MKLNLIEYFEITLKKVPHKIAVVDGERGITFSELANKAKIVAHHLITKDDFINRPVAVYLSKSIETVFSDLGIGYSGNIYMNLDVKTPQNRIKNILDLIKPKIIITNSELIENIKTICPADTVIMNLDEIRFNHEVIDDNFIMARFPRLIDTDPYCIINTSGSTGTPKGVVLNHRSFFDFINWAFDTFDFSDEEVIGSLSPSVFDIYSFELCMLMSKGSTMVLIPDNLSAFPVKILKLMQENEVSFIFWVPTIMVNIANMNLLSKIELPSLKLVWFAGEVFPTKQFNSWRKALPQTTFANLYGPIEITLDCVYYIVNREIKDEEPIPIGYPCRNTDIIILNEKNERVAEGEEGELCVRGTSLAMGYYNNPEKTNAAFVQNPLNNSYPELMYRTGDIVYMNSLGEIIFKGRKDSLIKHLGYRIELGEIEHIIINTLKLVENGCVVYNFSKKEITLFYENKTEVTASDMRIALGQLLPKYMIPTIYHKMEELPRNTNGKIDRLMLNKKVNE